MAMINAIPKYDNPEILTDYHDETQAHIYLLIDFDREIIHVECLNESLEEGLNDGVFVKKLHLCVDATMLWEYAERLLPVAAQIANLLDAPLRDRPEGWRYLLRELDLHDYSLNDRVWEGVEVDEFEAYQEEYEVLQQELVDWNYENVILPELRYMNQNPHLYEG